MDAAVGLLAKYWVVTLQNPQVRALKTPGGERQIEQCVTQLGIVRFELIAKNESIQ